MIDVNVLRFHALSLFPVVVMVDEFFDASRFIIYGPSIVHSYIIFSFIPFSVLGCVGSLLVLLTYFGSSSIEL